METKNTQTNPNSCEQSENNTRGIAIPQNTAILCSNKYFVELLQKQMCRIIKQKKRPQNKYM